MELSLGMRRADYANPVLQGNEMLSKIAVLIPLSRRVVRTLLIDPPQPGNHRRLDCLS